MVVYALLTAVHQRPAFGVIIMCILVVGNLLVPLWWFGSRIYAGRPFPWNWVLFFPVQTLFGLVCAIGSAVLLQATGIVHAPVRAILGEIGPLTVVVCLTSGTVVYAIGQVQRKLKEKNQILEQKVEKGTVALQQQEEELNRASEIQQMLLPNKLDVIPLDDNRLGLCIGDVAGKGITAALLMANLQASFRAFATVDATPASVCSKLNTFLCSNVASGKFVTFFYAVLDAEKRTLTYENAGHCPGFLIPSTGAVESLAGNGAVLGVFPEWIYQDFSVDLAPGDRLLLFTDGITEAENARLEEFGETRLVEAARSPGESALDIQRKIMQQVSAFCAGNFRDDATLIVAAIQ